MKPKIFTILAVALMLAGSASAQTSQPAMVIPPMDRGALEVRANNEFSAGNYALALPMLQKLEEMSKDRGPDVLGAIREKTRVAEKGLADNPAGAAGAQGAIVSDADRKPHPKPKPGEVLELTIKDLGNFNYDADHGGNIPADVKQLSGAKVRLKGFMIPMDQAANITQFALVPDLFACCFGQAPQLQHTIVANCPKGKAVSYYPDEITVEGTLKVEEKKDEGFIISIFEVEVSSVKPSAK